MDGLDRTLPSISNSTNLHIRCMIAKELEIDFLSVAADGASIRTRSILPVFFQPRVGELLCDLSLPAFHLQPCYSLVSCSKSHLGTSQLVNLNSSSSALSFNTAVISS
ncbi:hypothetical protein OIU74_020202 [Salix koriyanagi]|uniref:Uncharacterized protein n=1 Tax=Salix koriyanagi TaxID=2511006 RepID=A0A9Q0P5L2_9ROSI|nr:hypothetical protein OIU74_020202 [Salix koriyanagi]